MRYLMAVVVLVLSASCHADDGAIEGDADSGPLVWSEGENQSIRMASEYVRLDVYPDRCAVDARFVFRNKGPATTVTMGFPECGSGKVKAGPESLYHRFASWVDSERAVTRRVWVNSKDPRDGYYWVKKVSFEKDETHIVRVSYTSDIATDGTGTSLCTYPFTGGNWYGTVGYCVLIAYLHLPGTSRVAGDAYDSESGISLDKDVSQDGSSLKFVKRDWQAEGGFTVSFVPTVKGWLDLDPGTGTEPPITGDVVFGLDEPGVANKIVWIPPALVRNKVAYVQLHGVADSIRYWTRRPDACDIKYGAAAESATLHVQDKEFRFRAGQNVVLVDGKEIALPGPAFVLPRGGEMKGNVLYVPAQPLLDALGWTISVDQAHRIAHLMPKSKAPSGQAPATH